MSKPRILKVVNYREEDIPTLRKLEETLKREGKEYTDFVRECSQNYVKAHGEGNPCFPIDKWVDEPTFKALPTLAMSASKYCFDIDPKLAIEVRDLARQWVGETSKKIPKCSECHVEYGQPHEYKCHTQGLVSK